MYYNNTTFTLYKPTPEGINSLRQMKTLTIEKRNKEVSKVKDTLTYIVKTAPTKQEAVNRMRDVLSSEIKLGFGGSHVWGANQKNERLFIATGY